MEQSYPGSLLRLAAELAGATAGKKWKNDDPPAYIDAGDSSGKKSLCFVPPKHYGSGIKFDTGTAVRFMNLLKKGK